MSRLLGFSMLLAPLVVYGLIRLVLFAYVGGFDPKPPPPDEWSPEVPPPDPKHDLVIEGAWIRYNGKSVRLGSPVEQFIEVFGPPEYYQAEFEKETYIDDSLAPRPIFRPGSPPKTLKRSLNVFWPELGVIAKSIALGGIKESRGCQMYMNTFYVNLFDRIKHPPKMLMFEDERRMRMEKPFPGRFLFEGGWVRPDATIGQVNHTKRPPKLQEGDFATEFVYESEYQADASFETYPIFRLENTTGTLRDFEIQFHELYNMDTCRCFYSLEMCHCVLDANPNASNSAKNVRSGDCRALLKEQHAAGGSSGG